MKEKQIVHNDEVAKFKLYSLKELEPILGITRKAMIGYIGTGRLKAVKLGNRWKVSQENLQKFVNGEE
jgi:predicted site-specific integrase-resolvase